MTVSEQEETLQAYGILSLTLGSYEFTDLGTRCWLSNWMEQPIFTLG